MLFRMPAVLVYSTHSEELQVKHGKGGEAVEQAVGS